MDYQKIYNNLIERAKNRMIEGYVEKHHIVPKSFGGTNEKDNLVKLSAREHFIAHLLLVKIYGGKMVVAAYMMSSKKKYNSKKYENLKLKYSILCKLQRTGTKRTEKTKKLISESKKNFYKNLSDIKKKEMRKVLSDAKRPKMNDTQKRNHSIRIQNDWNNRDLKTRENIKNKIKNTKNKKEMVYYHHPILNKIKYIEIEKIQEFESLGYISGRGDVWMSNNTTHKTKRVKKSNIDNFLKDGWILGKIKY
jgi:hypothetical protein